MLFKAKYKNLSDTYKGLREKALSVEPREIGLEAAADKPVFGVVVDIGYSDYIATVVAITDGTASLYLSNGGGFIGMGQHPGPRRAAAELLEKIDGYLRYFELTSSHPLPTPNRIRLYLRTFKGNYTVETSEKELGAKKDKHPLYDLYNKVHGLIYEMRMVDNERGRS